MNYWCSVFPNIKSHEYYSAILIIRVHRIIAETQPRERELLRRVVAID